MSVRVTPYRRGGWEVDVRVVLPGLSGFPNAILGPFGVFRE